MPRLQQFLRPMAIAMALVVALVSLPAGLARAAMIPTDEVIGEQAAGGERARVEAFVLRADVRAQMAALGIDGEEAALRVAGLSDDEIRQIAGYLDQLPAGESAIGSIIGAAVLIFLILLLTDLLGLTDVFPFVRR
jgi:hypothetical protein